MPNEIMKHLEARGRTETPRTASREPMGEVIRKNSIIDLRLLISKAGERKEIAVPTGGWAGKTVPVKVPTDEAKAKYAEAVKLAREIAQSKDPRACVELFELLSQEGDPMEDKGKGGLTAVRGELVAKLVDALKAMLEDEYRRTRPMGFGL